MEKTEVTSHRDIKFDYVSTSQNPADLATRGVPADELIHNNLWWHGPSWLTDHPSQWPSWKSTQFDSKMSEQNTKQSPGPHVMYETTTLAGIQRESSRISLDKPVAPFDISERNYSSLTKLSECLGFATYPKTTEEIKQRSSKNQAKVMWEKYMSKRVRSHQKSMQSNKIQETI